MVSGYDMTPEAALTKLSYVLSKTELTYQQKVDVSSSLLKKLINRIQCVASSTKGTIITLTNMK